jgi:stage V sporulation protein AF
MRSLSEHYQDNVTLLDGILRVKENFDILKKTLRVGDGELTLYYIDGFIKDTVMQKLMMHFLSLPRLPPSASDMLVSAVPYVETDVTADTELMLQMVMSGATLMLGSTFGAEAILIDSRS